MAASRHRLRPPLQWDPQRRELAAALELARLAPGSGGEEEAGRGGTPAAYFCPPLPWGAKNDGDGGDEDGGSGLYQQQQQQRRHYRLDVEVGRLELAAWPTASSSSSDSVVVVVDDGAGALPAPAAKTDNRLERELLARFREHRRLLAQYRQQQQRELSDSRSLLVAEHDALLAARERLLSRSAAVARDLAAFGARRPHGGRRAATAATAPPLSGSVLVEGCTTNARRAALAEAALALERAERRARLTRRALEAPRRRLLRSAARLADAQRRLDDDEGMLLSGAGAGLVRLRVVFCAAEAAASCGAGGGINGNNESNDDQADVAAAADASLYGRGLLTRRQLDIALEAADAEALAGEEEEEGEGEEEDRARHHRFLPRRVETACERHARRAGALARRLAELRLDAGGADEGEDKAGEAAVLEARLLALGPAPMRAGGGGGEQGWEARRARFEAAAARVRARARAAAAEPPPLVEASLFLSGGSASSEEDLCDSTYYARLMINGRAVGCTRELQVGVSGGVGGGGGGGLAGGGLVLGPPPPPPFAALRPLPSLDWRGEVFSVRLARRPESARLELWERRPRASAAWRLGRRRALGEEEHEGAPRPLLLASFDLELPSGDRASDRPYDWSSGGASGAGAGAVHVRCAWAAERWREEGDDDGEEEEGGPLPVQLQLPLPDQAAAASPPPPFSWFTNPLASDDDGDDTAAAAAAAAPEPAPQPLLAPPPRPPSWRPARRSQQPPQLPLLPPIRPRPPRPALRPAPSSLFVPPARLAQLLRAAAIDPRDPHDRPLVELAILRELLGPEGRGAGGGGRRRQGGGRGKGHKSGALELAVVPLGPPSSLDAARRRWRVGGPFLPRAPSTAAAAAASRPGAPPPPPPPARLELWRQRPRAAEAWAAAARRRRQGAPSEEEEGEEKTAAVRDPWALALRPWWRPLSAGLGALVAAVAEPLRPLRGVRVG